MCWNNVSNEESARRHHCRRNNVAGAGEAVRIALRGPGCINGTGRCLRVLGDEGFDSESWPWINPERFNCRFVYRCLNDLLSDAGEFPPDCRR